MEAPRSPAGCRRCCRLLSPEMACRRGLLRQLLETRHLMPKSLKPRTAGKEIKKKKKRSYFFISERAHEREHRGGVARAGVGGVGWGELKQTPS